MWFISSWLALKSRAEVDDQRDPAGHHLRNRRHEDEHGDDQVLKQGGALEGGHGRPRRQAGVRVHQDDHGHDRGCGRHHGGHHDGFHLPEVQPHCSLGQGSGSTREARRVQDPNLHRGHLH